MAVRCPSLSAKARGIAAATSAAITLAILAAIAVGFAADEDAPPRTASLRANSCAPDRSDAAHAAAPLRPSHTKGDAQCRAS